jgi:hypothetical protein
MYIYLKYTFIEYTWKSNKFNNFYKINVNNFFLNHNEITNLYINKSSFIYIIITFNQTENKKFP